jgi:hypothetical protein
LNEYKIYTTIRKAPFSFVGRYRRDLETNNWHYYEKEDGTICHFRKDKLVAVFGDTAESVQAAKNPDPRKDKEEKQTEVLPKMSKKELAYVFNIRDYSCPIERNLAKPNLPKMSKGTEVLPKMSKEKLACMLNGRQCGTPIEKKLVKTARESGLIIIFNESLSNNIATTFKGLICEESFFGECVFYIDPEEYPGLFRQECKDVDCPHFEKLAEKIVKIELLLNADKGGPTFSYDVNIPHATFIVYDDSIRQHCKGIVIDWDDVESV